MVLAIDLGGTKLATALVTGSGTVVKRATFPLGQRTGPAVGAMICEVVATYVASADTSVEAVGISVPGIARKESATVWAPNIPGWEDYPLVREVAEVVGKKIPVTMDSDRACSMLGELWLGNARDCHDAIFLAVGTGIGAGILVDGKILRGANDIAGSIGWMALDRPFHPKYVPCGCFEYYGSGDGIAKLANEMLEEKAGYKGALRNTGESLTAHHVLQAYEEKDSLAIEVLDTCVEYWGMAAANLISIFNPEKIIFGGGVFGPAVRFLGPIQEEARKWAQPVSMTKVTFEPSALRGDAAIYGAALLGLRMTNDE